MSASSTSVVFVQYTNPAGYPPIVHAAHLLADAGSTIRVIGIALGEMTFPAHERISVELLPAHAAGWRQRIGFLRFVWHVCRRVRTMRPQWIYASDPLSTPAAWLAARLWNVRCIYHEHDAPEGIPAAVAARVVAFFRRHLAALAEHCVVPSKGRADALGTTTGRGDATVIWNTPTVCEVAAPRSGTPAGTRLLFHGSIVPARVPETLLHAVAGLPPSVTLCVTGYDPSGGAYQARLEALTRTLRIEHRVEFRGVVARRDELMQQCRSFDVGLALLPLDSTSVNERTMVGASNKPFDYLAGGLALLVPDLPDWRQCFVEPGYGLACDPASVESLMQAISRFDANPEARQQMGERGRQRIAAEWNYDRGFRPVLQAILAGPRGPRT
jgi:glycosyltransferase involved in cell wall biosynthesis